MHKNTFKFCGPAVNKMKNPQDRCLLLVHIFDTSFRRCTPHRLVGECAVRGMRLRWGGENLCGELQRSEQRFRLHVMARGGVEENGDE